MSFSVLKKCHTFAEATMLADDIVDRFADLESIGTLATTQHPDEVQQCATDILTIGLLWHTYQNAVMKAMKRWSSIYGKWLRKTCRTFYNLLNR